MATSVNKHQQHELSARPIRQATRMRLVDDVVESLEDAILAGKVRPGERLIENRLCDMLGVSRTTLREALLTLQSRGLIRSEPRRGTFVNRLSREESLDLRRARATLEAYAVSSGLSRLTESHFDEMQELIDAVAACQFPDDIPGVIRIDLAFHGIVIGAANSPVIHELWSSLNGRMSAIILGSIEHHHADSTEIARFHQVLLEALRTGDPEVASEALVAHYVGASPEDGRSLTDVTRMIEDMTKRATRENH